MAAWPRYAVLAGLAIVIAFLSLIYGYRFGFWGLLTVFEWLKPFTFAAFAGALLAAAGAGGLIFRKNIPGTAAALAVAATAAGLGYMPIWMRGQGSEVPPIHDITTDVENPPSFVAIAPLRADAPNPVEYDTAQTEQQLEAYPDLTSLVMPKPLPEAFEIALKAVKAEGLKVVAAVPAEGRIEAYATVPLWGFKDDVVVRLRDAHSTATVIDVRSKSRVGRSDLGYNAKRIGRLLAYMEDKGGRLSAADEAEI